jgi:PhnB protein
MALYPYLFLSGTCREAFTRYQEVFGGELVLLPMSDMPSEEGMEEGMAASHPDLIMHAALTFDGQLLMGSDDPTGDGGPMRGISVNYTAPDVADVKRVFDALADGGEVTMPLSETFWAPLFGVCVDRFGVPWMVNAESQEPRPS